MNLPKNKLVIVSGGQTGVDRAALDFALSNNMLCRGWCPLGRLAEDGVINTVYPLSETWSPDPCIRTGLNIEDSDATLIIIFSEMDPGTQLTFDLAYEYQKPLFIWEIENNKNLLQFKNWMMNKRVQTLNIAGPRESNSPGIYEATLNLLDELLSDYYN